MTVHRYASLLEQQVPLFTDERLASADARERLLTELAIALGGKSIEARFAAAKR